MENVVYASFYKHLRNNKAVYMFNVFSESSPVNICALFDKCKSNRSMNFKPPKPRFDLFETSISYSGTKIWNSLPLNP